MDKDCNWMNHKEIHDRRKHEYIAGVNEFLQLAFKGKEDETDMMCPYVDCNLCLFNDQSMTRSQLIVGGMLRNYNPWIMENVRVMLIIVMMGQKKHHLIGLKVLWHVMI